jgi:dTMP kinase
MGWHEVARRGVTSKVTKGKFITLEGGEGVGKSTQAARLADALRARGVEVVVTREPGGTAGAEAIRDLLMTGSEDRWSARAEALLFAAARADHVEKVIRPALERGAWVICDRFIDSTRAYQGGAGGVSDADIIALHKVGSDGLMPDRTLLLTMPVFEASLRVYERDGRKADRFAAKEGKYFDVVDAKFGQLASMDPTRIKRVSGGGSIVSVTKSLLSTVEDLL